MSRCSVQKTAFGNRASLKPWKHSDGLAALKAASVKLLKMEILKGYPRCPGAVREPAASVRYRDFTQKLHLVQDLAGALDDAGEGVFGDRNRKLSLFPEYDVQVFEKRAASGQDYALVDQVGRKLRRGRFEHMLYRFNEGVYRLHQAVPFLPPFAIPGCWGA